MDKVRKVRKLPNGSEKDKKIKKRKSSQFFKELPKNSGAIVAMVEHNGKLYVASQKALWYLSDLKTRLTRCKFSRSENV